MSDEREMTEVELEAFQDEQEAKLSAELDKLDATFARIGQIGK